MKKPKIIFKIRSQSKRGFTLIEVIIAVSIVIILASLSVPKVSAYVNKAKDAKILSTSKQIYTAVMWSYNDQGNTFIEANIKTAISSVLGNVGVVENSVAASNNLVTIPFISDNIECKLKIRAADNSYEVEKSNIEIFDSNPSADTDTVTSTNNSGG